MQKKAFLCFLFLTLIWMGVIFVFSSKDAEHSHQDSLGVGQWIGRILYDDFDQLDPQAQDAFIEKIEHPIRKCAHASEYAVLGMLLLGCISCYRKFPSYMVNACLAWVCSASYACTDEFHQLFVPGRSGQITDVMIDSMGALGGILLVCFLNYLWNCVNCRKNM